LGLIHLIVYRVGFNTHILTQEVVAQGLDVLLLQTDTQKEGAIHRKRGLNTHTIEGVIRHKP
jgi:hypothetical protein